MESTFAQKKEPKNTASESGANPQQGSEHVLGAGAGMPLFLQRSLIQPKLALSQPGDTYEEEADRVAGLVMRMAAPSSHGGCPACATSGKFCPKCAAEPEYLIQRKVNQPTSSTNASVPHHFLQNIGTGQPLHPTARAFMEPRFNRDFKQVRVHTDSSAAAAARAIQARAFTVGQDIVFASGEYLPETPSGQHLLAHELTHVVQQTRHPQVQTPCIQRQLLPEAETASDSYEVLGAYTSGDILLSGGERVIAISSSTGEMLRVQLPAPWLHAYRPFEIPRRLLRPFGQALTAPTSGVHESPFDSPAQREGVSSLKWSIDSERMYRNSGDIIAADAIRACRTQRGEACRQILTEEEAMALSLRESSGAEIAPAADTTPLLAAGMVVGSGMVPTSGLPPGPLTNIPPAALELPPIAGSGGLSGLATQTGVSTATTTAATTTATTTAATTAATGTEATVATAGLTVAEAVPPLLVALYLAAATADLFRYTAAQRRLIARGYIILRSPQAVCIGSCHSGAPRLDAFSSFPQTSMPPPNWEVLQRFLESTPHSSSPVHAPRTGITPLPPPWILPPSPTFFPWYELGRGRRRDRNPFIDTRTDPLTGEPYEPANACDMSPLHECSSLGYEFGSFAEALADLETRHPNYQNSGTQASTSGHCFKDGNPRSSAEALANGATHTTYRIPGVVGSAGVIASIVCCNCCQRPPAGTGITLPTFSQRCALVKERNASTGGSP